MPPLNEQIADRITNGSLTEARTQMHNLGEKYTELYSETRKLSRQVETLKEGGTLAEGYADHSWNDRLALDHRWQLMSGQAQHRIIQYSDVVLYYDLMSYAYQYCPLIKAAVDIKTRYTFGLSFSIESEIDANKTAIDEIMGDPRNRNALFGAQALAMSDREIQKAGSIYLAMWIDESPVQVRVWTAYDITDVILDPEDGDTPLYYVRSWAPPGGGKKTVAYPSIFNTSPESNLPREFSGYLVDPSIVVYQMSEGRAAKQKWALSPYTSALPWNRAYEQFLLDFAAIVQIIRKYSTMFTTKGGEAQVSALSTQFNHEQHGHHRDQVGDGIIATEGNDYKVIDAGSGKIVGPGDSRFFLLQVCASTYVPENMITGNLQTGNRASAQEMTANFLPVIEERQTMWTETFEEIFSFILGNRDFTVSFPPIRAQDALTYLQTLTQAATLGQAGKFAGTIRPEDFIRAAYEAMDIKVPDDMTIDEMVQAIMDAIATNPADTAALDNLTQATNQMNATVTEMMKKPREEWDPNQPRDDDGKWGDGGGGSSGGPSGGSSGGPGDSGSSSEKSSGTSDISDDEGSLIADGAANREAKQDGYGFADSQESNFSSDIKDYGNTSYDESYQLRNYTEEQYEYINSALRSGNFDKSEYGMMQSEIDGIIDSAPAVPEGATLYRGVGVNSGEAIANAEIGSTFTDAAYQSHSLNPATAAGFAKEWGDEPQQTVIRVVTSGKEKGVYLNSEAHYEHEMIFARDSSWKVVGKETRESPQSTVHIVTVVRADD